MAFHVPPSTAWRPDEVRDSLVAKGLPARVESDVLLIDVPRHHHPNPLIVFFRRSAFYCKVFGSGYRPYHEFRLHENRFINNLEIHWNVDALAEDHHVVSVIRDVMASHGYPEVGLKPTEREVARGYGTISRELDETLSDLETLRDDQAAHRDQRQFWDRWRLLNAKLERLCVAMFRDQIDEP